MPRRAAVQTALSDDEWAELETRARRRKTARGDAQRAAIVLLAVAGESKIAIAARLGVTRVTVTTWRNQFARRRLQELRDEPRPGRHARSGTTGRRCSDGDVEEHAAGATHWTRQSFPAPVWSM
jgi:transposase